MDGNSLLLGRGRAQGSPCSAQQHQTITGEAVRELAGLLRWNRVGENSYPFQCASSFLTPYLPIDKAVYNDLNEGDHKISLIYRWKSGICWFIVASLETTDPVLLSNEIDHKEKLSVIS